MRVGIVGAGFMGQTHAQSWAATQAQITAIHAATPESTHKLARAYSAAACPSLDDLLRQVDVVDICTPTHTHHPIALKASQAGKHIICEKPLARTATQGQEMLNACAQAGVQLLVAHVLRFFPEYAAARAEVEVGAIGDVAVVRLTRCSFQPWAGTDHWLLEEAKSGGMVLDLMIHDFDYARWIAGEVDSVFARSVRGRQPDAKGDYCLAILNHAGGAVSNIEGGWAYPKPIFRTALEIAGSGGLIEHPAESSNPLGIYIDQHDETATDIAAPPSPLAEDPFTTQIKHFYDVLANGASPVVTAEDALAALQIGLAAVQSTKSGNPVRPQEVQ